MFRKLGLLLLGVAFVVGCQETPEIAGPADSPVAAPAGGNVGGPVDAATLEALSSGPKELGEVVVSHGLAGSAISITPIPLPDAAYVASTALIDISGLGFLTNHASITDGTETVSFSSLMNKLGPVPLGWATWSSPPFSETATPHVLFSQGVNLQTWTLSTPVSVFGFELEPEPFSLENFTVRFFSGVTLVGAINQSVNGLAGARLFAAQTNGPQFDSVNISGSSDFAVARVRYDPRIFAVIDIKPGSDPNSINCNNANEVIAVAILTTDDFDATTVDHTTVTFEGADETHVDKKTGLPRRHEEDVDGDGDTDLVFHFRLGDTGLNCASTDGTLTGETFGGTGVVGTDAVRMVEPGA